jgi:AcrR family transcriptional regulator
MSTHHRMVPDERRASILQAAREQFSGKPYAAVSVAEIAASAGVSPPLVVFYFGTKRALYVEVIQAAADAIRDGLRAIPGPPSLDRLFASVCFYAGYARTHRAGFLSLVRGGHEAALPETAEIIEALRSEVTQQILGDLPDAADPAGGAVTPAAVLAIRGYLAYVDAAVAHWLALPDGQRDRLRPEAIARLAVGAFTGGLAALTPDLTSRQSLIAVDQQAPSSFQAPDAPPGTSL